MDPDQQQTTPEMGADTNSSSSEPAQQKPTPWYGMPRCDELPEPSTADKALSKAGQWAQDKVLKGAPAPLKWLANKIAPWNFKDGPMGRCPIDDDKGGAQQQ